MTVGYHGVPRTDLDSVMSEGLLRDRTQSWGCQQGGHVAIAETSEIAACFGDVVLVIDLDGLEGLSEFHGRVKEYGKQSRSLRRVPLRARVVAALEDHPWRIDSPLVYPGERGGYLNLHAWRRDEWYPAVDAAGLPKLTPYSMRHSFASFSIAAGVSLFYLSRLMGTSAEQLDTVYGHMLPDSEEYLRGLLDNFDATDEERAEGLGH